MRARDPFAHPEAAIRRVYAYVAYRIGPGAAAEDVTSEAILRAVRYRNRFDPKKGDALAWLVGIARTCLADHFARRVEENPPAAGEPSSGDFEADVVRRLSVTEAVSRLPERDRELIALRYGADLSTAQIAALLGMSTNAVDVALNRSRSRLRSELEQEGFEAATRPPVRARPAPQSDG
jgi:RNA polymerase sigma-70 factor, ECF subfamily